MLPQFVDMRKGLNGCMRRKELEAFGSLPGGSKRQRYFLTNLVRILRFETAVTNAARATRLSVLASGTEYVTCSVGPIPGMYWSVMIV